jgi:fucose permease
MPHLPARPKRRLPSSLHSPAWIGIAIAFYAFIAIGSAEGGLGVLLPSILSAYNLTPATVTFLFISQMTGYIVAALGSSLISQRFGLARMLLLASSTLMLALLVYALATDWLLMVAAGTLLGLGIGLIDAGINAFMVKEQRDAKLMGWLHAFYGIGALLGPTIATTLLSWGLNWRQVYLVLVGLVGILVASVVWAVLSHYRPMMASSSIASDCSGFADLQLALKNPIVLITGLLLFIYVGTETSIGNWAYTVQHVDRGISTVAAGYSVSAYWLGLTIGRLTLGYTVAKLGATRMISVSLLLLAIGLLMWWQLPEQWFSLPLMGFALAVIFPTTVWLIPQRVPAHTVAAAIGFVTSVASLGAALMPTVMGWAATFIGLSSIPVLVLGLAVLMMGLHRWLSKQAVMLS